MKTRKKNLYEEESPAIAIPNSLAITDNVASTQLITTLIDELSTPSRINVKTERVQQLFDELKSHTIEFILVSSTDDTFIYRHPDHTDQQVTYRKNANGSWDIFPGPGVDCIIPDDTQRQLVIIQKGQPQFYGTGPFPMVRVDPTSIRPAPEKRTRKPAEAKAHSTNLEAEPTPSNTASNPFPEYNIKEVCTRVHKEALQRIETQFSPHFVAIYRIPTGSQDAFKTIIEKLRHTQCPKTFSMDMARAMSMLTQQDAMLPPALGSLPHTKGQHWYSWFQADHGHAIGMELSQTKQLQLLVPQALSHEEYAVFSIHKNDALSPGEVLYLGKGGNTQLVTKSCFPEGTPQLSTDVRILDHEQEQTYLSASRAEVDSYIKNGLPAIHHRAYTQPKQSRLIQSPAPSLQNNRDETFTGKIKLSREKSASILGLPSNIKISPSSLYELRCAFNDEHCWGSDFDETHATVYVLQKRGVAFAEKELSGTLIIEVSGNPGDDDYSIRIRCGYKAEGIEKVSDVDATITVHHKGQEFRATVKDTNIIFDASATNTPYLKSCWSEIMCVEGCCGNYSETNQHEMLHPSTGRQRDAF
ncbi:MAG: hypothetical protein IPP74_08420 [Alphaproteobacteria bacterium]|nr:hypothetical protein [Alphaproteobacteria bacterium]